MIMLLLVVEDRTMVGVTGRGSVEGGHHEP